MSNLCLAESYRQAFSDISLRLLRGSAGGHAKGKGGVIQAGGIFIDQHPEHRRTRGTAVGRFAKGGSRGIAVMVILIIKPGTVDGEGGRAVMVAGSSVKTRVNGAHGLAQGKGARGGHNLTGVGGIGAIVNSLTLVGGTAE